MSAIRFAAALLPDGLPLPILRGPAAGGWWLVGAAPGPSKGLSVIWNRSEPEQLAAAKRLAQGASCCLDIGAHAGLYALVFARGAQRVFAFEPYPRNVSWLIRTLEKNRVDNVAVLPWAVAESTGLRNFRAGAHHSLGRLEETGEHPVFAVSLADFLDRAHVRPEVLKIDVEGAEAEVLRGGLEYLRARKPALLLSVHGPACRRVCLDLIRDLGYARLQPLNTRDPETADEYCVEA